MKIYLFDALPPDAGVFLAGVFFAGVFFAGVFFFVDAPLCRD